jgi:hypothetical protein
MTEETLKFFIKEFGKNGLSKVPNENVHLITFQVDDVAECLADSGLLRSESLTQYLEGFTYCSIAKFKMVFVNKSVEYTSQDAMGGSFLASMSSNDVLLLIKETSCAAVSIYDHLQLGKKWNLPGKHANNAVIVPTCDNCDNPNHLSPKFPKPYDEEKCKKTYEARKNAHNSEGGRSGQGRGGRGGDGNGAGRGSGSDGKRAPWESTTKSNTSGVNMIDGVWKMCFKICGWNETHTKKIMRSSSDWWLLSKCHHTIHIGFFQENHTLPPQLLQES